MDVGRMILYGLVRSIPLATAFGAYTITRGRNWGTVSSAAAASLAGMAAGVGAFWVERQILESEITEAAELSFGEGGGAATSAALNNLGFSGVLDAMTPDMRRNIYGVRGAEQFMSPAMRRNIYGGPKLGLVSVSRDFRRYG